VAREVPGQIQDAFGNDESNREEEVGGWQHGYYHHQTAPQHHSLFIQINDFENIKSLRIEQVPILLTAI